MRQLRLMTPRVFLSGLVGLLACCCHLRAETILFVSPAGNDQWSGRQESANPAGTDGPFATVARALEAVAAIRRSRIAPAPLEVRILPGRHELAETLHVGPEHSGYSPEAPVTLRGMVVQGERPVLSGGRRLVTQASTDSGPPGWVVQVPEIAQGKWYPRLLSQGDTWLPRARQPNTGFFKTTGPLSADVPLKIPIQPLELRSDLAGADTWLIMWQKWSDLHLPLIRLDPGAAQAVINTRDARPFWMDEPDARYWIENSRAAMDLPGEWVVEGSSGTLRGLTATGPNRALPLVAARLSTLIEIHGARSGAEAVHHFRLENLTLADANYDLPAGGLISPQAAVFLSGAVHVQHAVRGRITNCRFTRLGGYGLELAQGCQHWVVERSEFEQLGAGALRLGVPGGNLQDPPAARTHNLTITDNEIHQLGLVFAPACGILLFQASSNHIAHNQIHDLAYTGISVGWTWGYADSPSHHNLIESNHIHHLSQGRLSDMGGIYLLGPQPGTVVRGNWIHDVESYRYGGWGLYTDEGSTGMLLEGNVVYRCKDAGFHQHYGRDNTIRNNILVDNQNHSVMRTRSEAHRSFWFTNNIIVGPAAQLLGSDWTGTTNQFWSDANVWFDPKVGSDTSGYRFGPKAENTWAAWQKRGQDVHSVIADPLWVDATRPELGVRPDSPAVRLGFQPVDVSHAGVRR